ncbi:hypothetical protein CYLTODRAFT_425241 [Cylindrobasidium torrendii FP15055 ss-10]|uniref:Ricin B lectin domain-containing protein n=1 Tax=Cylindrobasidium torrendii FP15055 ss-10 TaxID=1314674 RepID=A0A0D7B4G7_9AGAR|nr:hypothetical protein CYLTODRAFT_425241 [Cylindrobasidium torrendii FP15055 ss-10]
MSTTQLKAGVYRIVNEASQSSVRVHQIGRPMKLSYGFELLGSYEQFELLVQPKGEYLIKNMGFAAGEVGMDIDTMVINGGNPLPFALEYAGDGLYAVKATDKAMYWSAPQSPTRRLPDVDVELTSTAADGEFSPSQLWRFERLDVDEEAGSDSDSL